MIIRRTVEITGLLLTDTDADIVVLAAGRSLLASLNPRDMFEVNAGVIESHAMVCATTCPNALVAVTTWPSIYNVPLVSEVYKRLGVYNPDKIIGNCTLNVMCANTILGNEFYLDPESIHVPLAGGNSSTTMVPLLSKAQPFAEFSQETAEKLTEEILMCNRRFSRKHSRPLKATRAHAINRFVLTLVRGLMDQPDAIMTAFVRSNVLPHCKYCASQLLFGPQGVKLNFGIPKITPYELDLLSTSVAELTRVYEFVEKYSESEFDYRKRRSLDRCFTQPGKKQMFAVEQTC
ncbi:hypothetical protein C0J52_19104 [Blattella germanica]|nr:hypothetical protein C0J52_19104 [Blattella germanica]